VTERTMLLVALVGLLTWGCVGPDVSTSDGAGRLAVDVAALNLTGVGDVVWDVEVVNGRAPTADVVWRRRLTSSGYGDGAGSASYVGSCDADPAVAQNTVRVWVVGVFDAPVSDPGVFAAGGAGGLVGAPLEFQSPTTSEPLTREVRCVEGADAAVQLDVALMRPARQGFFDIAVSFDDVFCAAKFDCCVDGDDDGVCDADLQLLADGSGARGRTMILGFACTAATGSDAETELYLDPLALDCSAPTAESFEADLLIDPSGPAGNQCSAGATGGGDCAAVSAPGGQDADGYLYQVAVYRGFEQLSSGGAAANKVYWNVALGVGPGISGCRLRTRGTADDALGTSFVDLGTIAAGAVYPYIQWDVPLGGCASEALAFDDDDAMVSARYTTTDDDATSFAFGFGPSLSAGTFCGAPCEHGACVSGVCVCDAGYSGATCGVNDDDCLPGACGAPTGGTCVDGIAAFTCDCDDGFYGDGTTSCAACTAVAHCTAVTCSGPGASTCTACASGYTLSGGACVPAGLTCGGVLCPSVSGYTAACNTRAHCEYARTSPTQAWHADHVWIYVPAGSFPMGAPSGEALSTAAERPVHTVTFASGFLIAKYEVSTRAYEACQAASSCTLPSVADWDGTTLGINRSTNGRGAHPQNGVNWTQAQEVCAWLGGRRPTEAEWERAATGTTHRKYPWGNTPEPTCANNTTVMSNGTYGCGTGGTAAIGTKAGGMSPVGALDLSGNAFEWVEDCVHSDYTGAPTDGSAWTTGCSNANRMIRGGSFYDTEGTWQRTAARGNGITATRRNANIGARCARTLP